MKVFKLLITILILVLIIPHTIYAAEDKDVQISILTLTVPPACRLVITNPDATKTLDKTQSAFDAGYIEFDPKNPALTVFANSNWKLSARSSGFSGPYQKPIGDLMLKDAGQKHVTNGFNTYKPLSLNDQEIASYTKGVKNEIHPCQYKILLDWEKDVPGTYSATVTYTLTTNAS